MGTDVLSMYEGTFKAGQVGFRQAKADVDEASLNRTRNVVNAIPSLKLLISFLPKIKEEFSAESTTYLTAFLQVRLWGLKDDSAGSRCETRTAGCMIRL
jgi:hypothetical protein